MQKYMLKNIRKNEQAHLPHTPLKVDNATMTLCTIIYWVCKIQKGHYLQEFITLKLHVQQMTIYTFK